MIRRIHASEPLVARADVFQLAVQVAWPLCVTLLASLIDELLDLYLLMTDILTGPDPCSIELRKRSNKFKSDEMRSSCSIYMSYHDINIIFIVGRHRTAIF